MNEKDVLKYFCDRATKIANKNGFDIDIANDFWFIASYDQLSPNRAHVFWIEGSNKANEPYYVNDHIRYPLSKFFDGNIVSLRMFNDDVPNIVYEIVLKSLINLDTTITIKKDGYDEAKLEYDIAMLDIRNHVTALKSSNPNFVNDKKLVSSINNEMDRALAKFSSTAEFTFLFAPKGINTVEKAKIWHDMNDDVVLS